MASWPRRPRTGVEVEIIDVPDGHHGFDAKDYTEQSRQAVTAAVRSVLRQVGISDDLD